MLHVMLHLNRRSLHLGLSTVLLGLLACSPTYRPYQVDPNTTAILSIGEGLSFSVHALTFYENGLAVFQEGGPKDKVAFLRPDELARLRGFLASQAFSEVLTLLRLNGYSPGCCDIHEVSFVFHGENLGYPVWQPGCREIVVQEPVANFIDLVNEIGARHFRRLRRDPLSKITCIPTSEIDDPGEESPNA